MKKEKKKKGSYEWFPGEAYFPKARRPKYHQHLAISLLCSEWEEVGHTRLNHQETAHNNPFIKSAF